MALAWGVIPVLIPPSDTIDDLIRFSIKAARKAGHLNSGQHVVITMRSALCRRNTNFIKVEKVESSPHESIWLLTISLRFIWQFRSMTFRMPGVLWRSAGCPEGRSSESWIDFNFFGHQLVCHLHEDSSKQTSVGTSSLVDDHDVPVPHFGAVLDLETWGKLSEKLKSAKIRFVIEPHIRFRGQSGEQATMFR